MLKRTRTARGIAVLIVLVAIAQLTCILVASLRFVLLGNHIWTAIPSVSSGFITGAAGSFVADTLIAGCQIAILAEVRSNNPLKRTETMITKLIVHAVETAAVTALASLLWLILFTAMSKTFMSLTAVFMLGKLYSNVLLANLNARSSGSGSTSPEMETHHMSSIVEVTTDVMAVQSNDLIKSLQINGTSIFP